MHIYLALIEPFIYVLENWRKTNYWYHFEIDLIYFFIQLRFKNQRKEIFVFLTCFIIIYFNC